MNELGRLRSDGRRRAVRFERILDAPPADVWAALVDPGQLARWLAPAQLEPRAGGTIRIEFGRDQTVAGTVLVWEPPRVLEYEWRFPGESESIVRFELSAHGAGTLLVLDHARLSAQHAVGYGAGWHAHLDRLAGALAGSDVEWEPRFDEVLPRYRAQAR
jgi:uncharacterized protein YndB with AHSA1/START domain